MGQYCITKGVRTKGVRPQRFLGSDPFCSTGDLIHFVADQLKQQRLYFGHGIANGWDEAVYLVLHTLGLPLDNLEAALRLKLDANLQSTIFQLIKKRIKKRIPAAYLTQEAWFAGLPFYVDRRVIIPRSPLAELITDRFVPWIKPRQVSQILDIGTGSGCIAIACAYAFPRATIDAIDNSQAALKVAKINCKKHKVSSKIHLIKSNLFTQLPQKKYDIIISNPPYVGEVEMKTLPKEYYFEPRKALLAGKLGDEIITKIIKKAPDYLSLKGILVVEVGNSAPLILQKFPYLPFVWLEFEHGASEVFLLTREQMVKNRG